MLGLTPGKWRREDRIDRGGNWPGRSYGGQRARQRNAHRTGDEIDGQRDFGAAIYRRGATDATIGTYDSRAAQDFFQWEALARATNIYDPGMYEAAPFDDEAEIAGLEKGELFFASIDMML